MENLDEEFNPDWASPPGDSLFDIMEERDLSTPCMAEFLGFGSDWASFMLMMQGEAPLTEEMAGMLEIAGLGTSNFWLQREKMYRERRDKINEDQV